MRSPRVRPSLALSPTLALLLAVAAPLHAQPTAAPAPAPDPHAGQAMDMGSTTAAKPAAAPAPVPLFTDLGTWHRAVTTSVPRAQSFFDQGLRLMYAFNLEEAQRAFEEATRLDPQCAACWWGVGLSLGPHINLPATPERTEAAYAATQKAVALRGHASPVEQALIDALAHRYVHPAPTDPAAEHAAEEAYANAMREVVRRFPDDPDVATFTAEALMDLRPWDLWTQDGKPQPGTEEILALLEGVLAKHPDAPGANHFYIHATEASPHPEKALAAADRLGTMMPGAGHLVHMPAHTYIRTGRYEQAAEANRRAIAADRSYVEVANPQGFYLMYVAHNPQFLWAAALLEGRSQESLQAARQMEAIVPLEMLRQMPGMDLTLLYPLWTLVRFGRADEALAEPAPPAEFAYAAALWHAARALALVEKKDLAAAEKELALFRAGVAMLPADAKEGFNSAAELAKIADGLAGGELALAQGKTDDGIAQLRAAVAAEDGLRYDEPADWYFPVRPALGAALLAAGRAAEAQAVYEEDLRRLPDNGYSLFGLAVSLRTQRKHAEATAAEARFAQAWQHADVKLASSWSTSGKPAGP